MRYEDFVLHLEPVGETSFRSRVVSSPAGEGECLFELPLGAGEIPALQSATARFYEGVRARGTTAVRASRQLVPADPCPEAPSLPRLGKLLFEAAIAGEVRSRLDQSLGLMRAEGDAGLRLRIQLSLGNNSSVRLAALPWELLFRSDEGVYLGLDPRTPIVRHLRLAQPARRLAGSGPIRVLVVGSSPSGLDALEIDREKQEMERVWQGQAAVQLEFPARPTLAGIRDQVRQRQISVLHFMGHGDVLPESNSGVVFLEDEVGGPQPVAGGLLADQLRDCSSLRLVFLNACRTAAVASAGFGASVASALLEAGVPAVVAMQFPVTDRAALTFGKEVYRQLAAGAAVDGAVAEARLALRRDMADSMEWATPVLFLRSDSPITLTQLEELPPVSVELPPQPRRQLSWAAGAVAVVVLGGTLLWAALQGIGTRPQLPEPGPEGVKPPPEPVVEVQKPEEQKPETAKQPPAGDKAAPHKPPPKPGPATYSLADGDSQYLKGSGATVSANFNTDFGTPFVRLAVAPDGGESALVPVMAPKSIPVGSTGKSFTVLSIDWTSRVVKLRG